MQKAKVNNPYIEADEKICGGSPVIKGTRMRVVDIAVEYEYLNHTPDEIINAHPLPQTRTGSRRPILLREQKGTGRKDKKRQTVHSETFQDFRGGSIVSKRIKIYADESVNIAIVEGLKRRGVEAFSAKDIGKLGLTDEQQIEIANKKQAVIFTHDVDFLRIAIHKQHPGTIYVHQ